MRLTRKFVLWIAREAERAKAEDDDPGDDDEDPDDESFDPSNL